MASFVALLRAVNVGGTGKLPMKRLVELCEQVGFTRVRTYIASGNAVFDSPLSDVQVKAALESAMLSDFGSPVPVAVRDAAALGAILRDNPFPDATPQQVMTIFLDQPTDEAMLAGVTGQSADEEVVLGRREIFVRYGAGVGVSKLRIPLAATGTARNMNTVAKLAEMLREQASTG